MSHATIPVFVPHLACFNECVFCNQKRIAGTEKPVEDVFSLINDSLKKMTGSFNEVDIAFFGGSFTGIEKKEMLRYLDTAKYFLENEKRVTGIRLSTRPDYISRDILNILKSYKVSTIELGIQSFNNNVLSASKRGHSAEQSIQAINLIKEYGFELVLQLMPGMPGDSMETILETAKKAALLKPYAVRIYPCIVIKDTELETMYLNGDFIPLSIEDAINVSVEMSMLFKQNNIKIIRIGLHSSDLVQNKGVVAGPFHPAFGEMVLQRIYRNKAEKLISCMSLTNGQVLIAEVAGGCISKMRGQKNTNVEYLCGKYNIKLKICENAELSVKEYDIKIRFE